jgi:hypothetical protein
MIIPDPSIKTQNVPAPGFGSETQTFAKQGVTKRCRLSLLTSSALVIRVQMRGEGGSCWVSAKENSCAHHVTWSPNKLWRSTVPPYLTYVAKAPLRKLSIWLVSYLGMTGGRRWWGPVMPAVKERDLDMIRWLLVLVGGGGRGRWSLGGRGAGAGGGVSLQPVARRLDTRLIVRPTTEHKRYQ